jgi:hypothetical protein
MSIRNEAPEAPAQFDMYGPIHRGMRQALCDLLGRMGTTALDDRSRWLRQITELEDVLVVCEHHVEHEEAHIHPALERARPGTTANLDEEHAQHVRAAAELRALAVSIRSSGASDQAACRLLYLRFSGFVGETLAHMAVEEEKMQELLEEVLGPAAMMKLHDQLIASVPPSEMMQLMIMMVPAQPPPVRAAMLEGARQNMPAEAFRILEGALYGFAA